MANKKGTKPPTQPKPKNPKNGQNKHNERLRRIGEQYKTTRWALITVSVLIGFCFASYCAMKATESVAGKKTDLNAAMSALADLRLSTAAGYALAAIFGGSTYYNWKGRKKAEKAAARAAEIEKLIDPSRKGSGLSRDGANPEEDAV